MTRRQPRHGPNDFYGSSGPPTAPGGAWPPPPLWRPPVSPMPARHGSAESGDGSGLEPHAPGPRPRWSVKHLVGYPATALLALAVGAAPSGGATAGVVSGAATPVPTVTVTAPAKRAAAPARTVTVTVAAAGGASSGSSSRSSSAGSSARSGVAGAAPVFYATCAEARDAGDSPLYVGDPGYRPALDRDSDGVACE